MMSVVTGARSNAEPKTLQDIDRQEAEGIHIMVQLFSPFEPPGPFTDNATRAASVNASLTPRFRFAEHSGKEISYIATQRSNLLIPGLT